MIKSGARILLAFSATLGIAGCQSLQAPIQFSTDKSLKQAIEDHDSKKALDILNELKGSLKVDHYQYYLQVAYDSLQHDFCNREIFDYLLAKGARPHEKPKYVNVGIGDPNDLMGIRETRKHLTLQDNLKKAYSSACPTILEKTLLLVEPIGIQDFVKANVYNLRDSSVTENKSGQRIDDPIFQVMLTTVLKRCQQGENDLCSTGAGLMKIREAQIYHLDEPKRYEAKMKAEEEKRAAPETLVQRACNLWHELKSIEESIKNENEVAKESGIINKRLRYTYGQLKVNYKKELNEINIEYKKKSGSEIDPSDCKSNE